MVSQMTRLAFCGKWSGLTTPLWRLGGAAPGVIVAAARKRSGLSSDVRARAPTPRVTWPRNVRRCWRRMKSVGIMEFSKRQQRAMVVVSLCYFKETNLFGVSAG
jgi:hypothetical protein